MRREVAEEVGLEVESLRYSASQHWPFPSSSLMIACHALVGAQRAEVSGSPQLFYCLPQQDPLQSTEFSQESIKAPRNAIFHWLFLQMQRKLGNNPITFCCKVPDFAQVTVYTSPEPNTPVLFCFFFSELHRGSSLTHLP